MCYSRVQNLGSSELSPQSLTRSQYLLVGIHLLFVHVNSDIEHPIDEPIPDDFNGAAVPSKSPMSCISVWLNQLLLILLLSSFWASYWMLLVVAVNGIAVGKASYDVNMLLMVVVDVVIVVAVAVVVVVISSVALMRFTVVSYSKVAFVVVTVVAINHELFMKIMIIWSTIRSINLQESDRALSDFCLSAMKWKERK